MRLKFLLFGLVLSLIASSMLSKDVLQPLAHLAGKCVTTTKIRKYLVVDAKIKDFAKISAKWRPRPTVKVVVKKDSCKAEPEIEVRTVVCNTCHFKGGRFSSTCTKNKCEDKDLNRLELDVRECMFASWDQLLKNTKKEISLLGVLKPCPSPPWLQEPIPTLPSDQNSTTTPIPPVQKKWTEEQKANYCRVQSVTLSKICEK